MACYPTQPKHCRTRTIFVTPGTFAMGTAFKVQLRRTDPLPPNSHGPGTLPQRQARAVLLSGAYASSSMSQ